MEILKFLFGKPSRESLMEKIQKRSEERIEDYVTLSTAFHPQDSKIIEDNLDAIARYAHRQDIDIAFYPNGRNLSAPKMEISRRVTKHTNPCDGSKPREYVVSEKAGSELLPEGIDNKKDLMTAIRATASKILYENK